MLYFQIKHTPYRCKQFACGSIMIWSEMNSLLTPLASPLSLSFSLSFSFSFSFHFSFSSLAHSLRTTYQLCETKDCAKQRKWQSSSRRQVNWNEWTYSLVLYKNILFEVELCDIEQKRTFSHATPSFGMSSSTSPFAFCDLTTAGLFVWLVTLWQTSYYIGERERERETFLGQ